MTTDFTYVCLRCGWPLGAFDGYRGAVPPTCWWCDDKDTHEPATVHPHWMTPGPIERGERTRKGMDL